MLSILSLRNYLNEFELELVLSEARKCGRRFGADVNRSAWLYVVIICLTIRTADETLCQNILRCHFLENCILHLQMDPFSE